MNIEQVRERFKGAYVSSYELAQKNIDDKYDKILAILDYYHHIHDSDI